MSQPVSSMTIVTPVGRLVVPLIDPQAPKGAKNVSVLLEALQAFCAGGETAGGGASILTGETIPSPSIGITGAFYFQIVGTSVTLWGPFQGEEWPAEGILLNDGQVIIEQAEAASASAETAASTAENSAAAAQLSATAAGGFATAAQTSQSKAASSAEAAAISASTATTQATVATVQAENAAESANAATREAGITTTQAQNAAASATEASASAAIAQAAASFVVNKSPVNLATLTPLPANTYSASVLTASANGALVVDGVPTALGNRILVGGETAAENNGLYNVTATGSSSTPYVLTRCSDANTAALLGGACVQALAGTQYTGWGFLVAQAPDAITIGITEITFTARGLSSAANAASIAEESSARIAAIAPIAAKVQNTSLRPLSYLSWAKTDVNGNILKAELATGGSIDPLLPTVAQTPLPGLSTRTLSTLSFAITDRNSNISYAKKNTGQTIDPLGKPLPAGIKLPVATMYAIPFYGQSLSVGTLGQPALTIAQPGSNLMFSSGLNQTQPGAQTAFSPAVEENISVDGTAYGESGVAAMANSISALFPNRYVVFCATFGVGGQSIAQLSKISSGTSDYANFIAGIQAYATLARAQGDIPNVPMVVWIQGENDYTGTSQEAYASALLSLVASLNFDIQNITGQTNPVLVVCSPPSSWTANGMATSVIPQAMIDAYFQNPDQIRILGPKYQYPGYQGLHLNNYTYRQLGLEFAKMYYQEFILGIPWVPVMPISAKRSGSSILVNFSAPSGELVFDTTSVTDPNGARGFEVSDSGGSLTIETVELIGKTQALVICNRALATDGSASFRTAWTGIAGNAAGPTTGARCCLRDTATFSNPYENENTGATSYALYNWCVTANIGIN
jgi:hypothetical protein